MGRLVLERRLLLQVRRIDYRRNCTVLCAEQPEEEALAASGRVKICAPGGERQQADKAGRFQLDPTGFSPP